MFAQILGETTCGIDGVQILVEVDVSNGLPSFDLVGLRRWLCVSPRSA